MEYIFSLPMTIGSFLFNAAIWGTLCYLCMSWLVEEGIPFIKEKVLNRGD